MEAEPGRDRLPWHLTLVFIVLAIGIGISGYVLYENQKTAFKKHEYNDLASITNFKVDAIVNWHKERLGDAQVVQQNIPAIRRVRQFTQEPGSHELKKEILSWLKSVKESYRYGGVFLLDTQGNVRLYWSDETSAIGNDTTALAKEALDKGKIVFSDFRRGQVKQIIRLDIFVPLLIQDGRKKVPVGIVILRIDTRQPIFSHILSWPTTSPSAEVVIAFRERDEVVLFTSSRQKEDKDLLMRFPISKKQLPAAMAARGEEGLVEGIDYRGVPVLAAIKLVPNTPWCIIAKIDKEEVYAPTRERFWSILILVSALIVTAGTVTGLFWRNQRARFYRKQYEMKLEREALTKHYEYLTRYANDIILMLDGGWNIVEANERAVQVYGYTRDELLGMNLQKIRYPEASPNLEELVAVVNKKNGFVSDLPTT